MEKLYKAVQTTVCTLLTLLFAAASLSAQQQMVSGRVTDPAGEPVIGATVVADSSGLGVVTDAEGRYSLTVPSDDVLTFSYMGLTDHRESVGGRTLINVAMTLNQTVINEVVVIGYGTQKRGSITGSVAAVKGSEMIQTKNENPQNMLTGRIPGLRVWQKSSEPGSYNNNFDVRGMGSPLIVIDGVPRSTSEFQRLNANDIDDISVLKDASAAIYGVRAANGVVLITTKKGAAGSAKVSYNGSYTFQVPSSMPTLCDPIETMTLFNEKKNNSIDNRSIAFTQEVMDEYRNGLRNTSDWTSLIFADFAPQTQHDVNLSGGNDATQYFVSLGYFYQEGFFRSGDLNYNKLNLRSNITTRIARGLKLNLQISGIADEQHNPYTSSVNIIRNYWRQGSLTPAYADPDNTMLNYDGLDLEENTVAEMTSSISGHRIYREKYFLSSGSLDYDFATLSPILAGLTARAMVSYDYHLSNNELYRKEYYQYAYDKATDSYKQKLYGESSPNALRREFYDKSQLLGQFTIDYNRQFGEHRVSALVGWEAQRRTGDNFYAQRNLAFSTPYLLVGESKDQLGGMYSGNNDIYETANEAFIGRLNYDFSNRYLLEAQFRYDGSSKFAKGHQWGFFPSVSAGWRVSEEPFFKDSSALSFINQLKLRASYGVLGDDGSLEYDWAMGYTYPSTSGNSEAAYHNQYAPGYVFDNTFVYAATPLALPNEAITWFTSKTFDVGMDFEAWNGLLGFSFDYFERYREGMFARQSGSLPTVIGATAPRENLDSDRQFGMELELTHRNRIGRLSYNIKGMATITRREYLTASEKGPWANSYDRWRNDNLTNRFQGVQFGLEGNGRYESWEDIWNKTLYHERDVLPGDYKYLDWNGDGEINSLDEHPIAYDQTPWLNFSLNFSLQYANFDFSMLLQGAALGSMAYREPLYAIWGNEKSGGGALKQYLDRWHTVDPTADPYDPATEWISGYYAYTGRYPDENSSFNRVSTDYLRLKSIELGYTLPRLSAASTTSLRIYANAYNLLTLTGVKFVDPEHPDDDLGRMYPLNKTYSLGLSLSF